MHYKSITIFILIFLQLNFPKQNYAQNWNFVKERNGVRIYTSHTANSNIKAFKGEVDLHTTPEIVVSILRNVNNFHLWDEKISEVKVLSIDKNQVIKYYIVYKTPWPVTDRDLCLISKISKDKMTGQQIILTTPLPNAIPEYPDKIRITNFKQKWTITSLGNGMIKLSLEGFVDPAGNVPDWLYNMVITETPLKLMLALQKLTEKK
jgi:hypothetical protein